jgi:hypothetical protein
VFQAGKLCIPTNEDMIMRALSFSEVEQVSGALLANIGMGVAGATMFMGGYALSGGISGNLSGAGFVGAGVNGFVTGAGGFNPASAIAGAAAGGAAESLTDDS